jgi:small conductance mechanosensitive channel
MAIFHRIGHHLSDERFLFNIVAAFVMVGVALALSALLRRLLGHGLSRLAHTTGWTWLEAVSVRLRKALFWLTLAGCAVAVLASVGYHLAGRHIRHDLRAWYAHLTWKDMFAFGVTAVKLSLVAVGLWLGIRQLRRLLPLLERRVIQWLGSHKEDSLRRWFIVLERYAAVMIGLGALWCAGRIVGLVDLADAIDSIVFHLLVILSLAHLLILSCHTLTHSLSAWGERHLAHGKFHRYWERVTHLFPFGERCFELAVYVSAGSLCIRELHRIAVVASFGPRIVQCIGIFFGTRVIIELSQVLLNEAFGMYEDEQPRSHFGETLVPLLQSLCQYVFYFGSGVMMLSVLGVPTSPILAGAGILGLAGGLGAQSLVTDIISGFFILFENQYLVGDYVKLDAASGKVEAVSIRCTHIRDEQGRLHIIPNGQIKGVVNYSKGYVNAEVDMAVPGDTNMDDIFRAMTEAGRRLRQARKEVLADTVVKGLVDLSPSSMTVRAVTKVQPGTHVAMQSEYRRYLKQVLDEQKAGNQVAPALAA